MHPNITDDNETNDTKNKNDHVVAIVTGNSNNNMNNDENKTSDQTFKTKFYAMQKNGKQEDMHIQHKDHTTQQQQRCFVKHRDKIHQITIELSAIITIIACINKLC